MSTLELERVQQADRVGRHVADLVRRPPAAQEQVLDRRHRQVV